MLSRIEATSSFTSLKYFFLLKSSSYVRSQQMDTSICLVNQTLHILARFVLFNFLLISERSLWSSFSNVCTKTPIIQSRTSVVQPRALPSLPGFGAILEVRIIRKNRECEFCRFWTNTHTSCIQSELRCISSGPSLDGVGPFVVKLASDGDSMLEIPIRVPRSYKPQKYSLT